MDKKIVIVFINGEQFFTNRNSFDTTSWGINTVGHFEGQDENVSIEVQIPWTSILFIEKRLS